MIKEYKRATQEFGLKAFSLGSSFDGIYLDDERFFEVYEAAESGGIPIFVHPQTINPIGYERLKHPLLTPVIEFVFDTTICIGKLITAGILTRFPDLKFVFAHFGGVTPFIKERFDSVYKMLRGREIVGDLGALPSDYLKKIYIDTCGVSTVSALKCTIEMVGAEHVLWGSDYPGNPDVPASIGTIESLDITSEGKTAMLGENASQLLGLMPEE
jgi:predicted TIM-barrel fold metal-dependent hydrolase